MTSGRYGAAGLAGIINRIKMCGAAGAGTHMINFDYDLDEIVQMVGTGPVSLRTALLTMPGRVDPLSVLHRKAGKNPAFFDAAQIRALLDRHRIALQAGKPLGHSVADEDDF
jgi:hypothetical protein